MSFKEYMKKGKDDMKEKKSVPSDKRIKDPKTIELPKINQNPKERIDLFGLLKNMKWEEHKLNKPEFSSTDEPEINEPPIARKQVINHDLLGKKNQTALVKAQLLRNHSNKKNIPETKPKVQINRPAPPKSPSQKLQNNAAMTKAQLDFSNKNPKKLPSLNISAKNANAKINGSKNQPQNQELLDTQNEIAKVQAQLEFLKNNPDYIPETDENEEVPTELKPALQSENRVLIDTQNEIAKVQAQLEFLNNNPDYIPETDGNDEIPTELLKPSVDSENQALIDTQKEIAKVQAQLEFLDDNPDYIPETDVNDEIPTELLKPAVDSENQALIDTQKEIAKVQAQLDFLKNNPDYIPESDECIPIGLNSSKVPLKSKPVTKTLPVIQSNNKKKQTVAQQVEEAENKIIETKAQLEILQDSQEESFEDYRKRMQKCNQKKKPGKLDTIAEEESEVFQDDGEEQEAEEVCEALGEEADEEECEEADEECEEADEAECEEECEEADEEECEEADEEETDEETQDVNEEELEDTKSNDLKLPAQQKIKLLDILKRINWIEPQKPSESVELEEVQSAESSDGEEESATECVELEEIDNEEVVESSEMQSDSLEKSDIKFDDLELQPFGTKKADSVSPKTSKEDVITLFFKSAPVPTLKSVSPKDSKEDLITSFFKIESSQEEVVSTSEKSSLNLLKLQEELLQSSSVATPKTEEVQTKSTSENEPEKSHASEDGSFSSFFEDDKPLIKTEQKMQSEPTESVSDQSKSLSETETTPKDLQQQPNTIEFNLEQSNGDEDLQRQPSLLKCNLEQDKRDETIPEGFKSNMETDKKTLELATHKIINVAPYKSTRKTVSRCIDYELDSSEKPLKPNSQYTEIREISSDSEKEESLKIESVHMSEDSSKGSRQSFICHLYKVKIRIKSINWQGSGSTKAVTLSFHNPFTKENAAVQRKYVLPYFYTADFYCSVPYITPPNMLDSSLAYYPPVILISKRKSVRELARGVLDLNDERLQQKSNSFYTNVPLTHNDKIIGDAMISIKLLDYGSLGDGDTSSNEIIEIVFKEIKQESKKIKIARPSIFVDKALQKKKKHLIVEESSSGDSTSSDLPPDQLSKKRPLRYKRETKSEGSFIATSSISIRADRFKTHKSVLSNCKDIQTDVQEEDLDRTKSKSKMIQTETEMDSKYTTTLQCESKVTQTEATSEQQTVITPKNEQPKKCKMVKTLKESPPMTTTAENEHYKKQQMISAGKNKMANEKSAQSSSITDESEKIWKTEPVGVKKPKKINQVCPEPLKIRNLTKVRAEEIFPESEEVKPVKSKSLKPLKARIQIEKVFPNCKQIVYPASEETESIKLEQNKSSRPKKSKAVKLKAAPKEFDLRIGQRKSRDHKPEALHSNEESNVEETPEAVRKYLEGKKLAERFLKVCTEQQPALVNKLTYEEQKLYTSNYIKRLRDELPSDFVTPPSIKTKEKCLSEKRWMSHMAAFLQDKKAMSSDEYSSTVDKTDDQVPEICSEVAAPDVLINNPDYHAMNKYYHPELCKADVMTSTSYPYIKPATNECGAQTSERVIKKFTGQTTEKLLPFLSKKPKKLASKTPELKACLVIVDTIPPAPNGSEKFINKNVLYEKVRQSEKLQDVKKSSKTIKLLKSNIQLESYPEQCSSAMPNKSIVKHLRFELDDFVKNIKLEVHVLKHHVQYTPDTRHHKRNSRESTDFDRIVNSFTSLVARNEERDFTAVYDELQQLQDLVYNTFKKFSEDHLQKTELHSKKKKINHDNNYVSQDKELKLIFKNPKLDRTHKRRSHGNKSFKAHSLPNIKSISALASEADTSGCETNVPFYTKFKNRFFKVPSKNNQVFCSNDSESTLTPLGEESKNTVVMLSLHTGEPIEIEKSQMEAIKDKMTTVQIKSRCYLHEREVLNSNINEDNPTVTKISKNILILLHEWRRLKAYVEQLYQL